MNYIQIQCFNQSEEKLSFSIKYIKSSALSWKKSVHNRGGKTFRFYKIHKIQGFNLTNLLKTVEIKLSFSIKYIKSSALSWKNLFTTAEVKLSVSIKSIKSRDLI